jgi:hypothetical protein
MLRWASCRQRITSFLVNIEQSQSSSRSIGLFPFTVLFPCSKEGVNRRQLRRCADAPCLDFQAPVSKVSHSYTWRSAVSGWFAETMEIPLTLPPAQVR